MFSAAGQAEAFLATVYAGLAAGIAYDLLRLLRLSLRAGGALTALFDIIFWILTAALLGAAAALSGVAGLRFYLILGLASGMLLWAGGIRRVIAGATRAILRLKPKKREGNAETDGESNWLNKEKAGKESTHAKGTNAP